MFAKPMNTPRPTYSCCCLHKCESLSPWMALQAAGGGGGSVLSALHSTIQMVSSALQSMCMCWAKFWV